MPLNPPSGGSVDGTAINPLSIGATTPVQSVDIQPLVNGAHTFRVRNVAGNEIIDVNTTTRTVTFGADSLAVNTGTGLTTIYNNGALAWTPSSGASGGSEDLFLLRDAANTLAQRNGTSAQESRLYGTYTSSTVYERMSFKYDSGSGAFVIGTEKGSGGGSARPLKFSVDGNVAMSIATSGAVTVAGFFDAAAITGNYYIQSPIVRTTPLTFATLTAAASAGEGARSFITDATLAYNGTNIGSAAAGGGANSSPVIVIGGAWVIG